MFSKCLVLAVTCSIALPIAALAHHGEHHEPPVPPPTEHHHHHHDRPVLPPPVVQPPVVQTPPPVPERTTQLPIFASPTTILPTDISGLYTGPDANLPKPAQSLSKEELAALTAKDSRFNFIGRWILFSSDYKASIESPYKPVSLIAIEEPVTQFGRIEQVERPKLDLKDPAFMPTVAASYSKVNDEHLELHDGAILVRAGDKPVFVSTRLCDERVVTKVAGRSIALVSAFDHRPTVLNLTDECCGAVVLHVPSEQSGKTNSLTLNPGQIAEAYELTSKPTSSLVATKVDVNCRIGPHCGLLVSQSHYIRALKRFNLLTALPQNDLDRVLKTAAAVYCARGTR